jgi:RNA polymerase sigma-70 factor, ECF subfamily
MGTGPDFETASLLGRAKGGDAGALDALLARHRDYLRRVVEARMDRRLRGRLDPSDIVQEALLDAARGFERYALEAPLPFHLWLRQAACDRLALARRQHLGAECRDLSREVALSEQSSLMLARGLRAVAGDTPLRNLLEKELAERVRLTLGRLPEADAEVILLRNLEGMSNQEAAAVLGIDPAAASKRYARALVRLEKLMRQTFSEDSAP